MNDEDTKKLLRDILKWQRLQGIKSLKEILPSVLDSEEKKFIYENTDGLKTARDLEKVSSVNKSTVSNWWKEWYSHGILEKEGNKYNKIISLKELGILIY